MWLGQIISNLGDTVNYIALVVDVYKISGSGVALSSLVLFQIVPVILIGPIAGDILLGLFTVPLLGQALLFMYGLNTSTGMVTYQSIMQSKVPDTMRGRVFALMDAGWNVARIVSVGLAGVLADRFGIVVVYYVGGALLIAAGILGLSTVHLDAGYHETA